MAVSALPRTMEALTRRATMLRDSLHKSQGNTDGMVAILGSFDHRLSALEAAMRPTQAGPASLPPSHSSHPRLIRAAISRPLH
ncbi:Exocyst complex component 7 [Hordeum vulgare]|nr:Exocyst complex component 7 [Hordeum vulgare]